MHNMQWWNGTCAHVPAAHACPALCASPWGWHESPAMALVPGSSTGYERHENDVNMSESTPTFEKFWAEYSTFMDRVFDDSVTMTEDELQHECQKLQEDVLYIQSYLHKDCNFDIQFIREQWQSSHDRNNDQLSKPEKRITKIRDFYWSIRECDKQLKDDIQLFIRNIAGKTVSDVVQMKTKLYNIRKKYDLNYELYGRKYEEFKDALREIEEFLPRLYYQFNDVKTEPLVQFCVNFLNALTSGNQTYLERNWTFIRKRRSDLWANKMDPGNAVAQWCDAIHQKKRIVPIGQISRLFHDIPKDEDEKYILEESEWFLECQKNAAIYISESNRRRNRRKQEKERKALGMPEPVIIDRQTLMNTK